MTQDIQQWLAEIKGLQQKLAEVQQERDQAYSSASNWRNLYETEAKQRRTEAQTARDTIAALQQELAALQRPSPEQAEYGDIVRQQVEQWQPEELKLQLMQSLLERDQLAQSLEAEQQAHIQTRQDLTTALGDTMELLTKARRTRKPEQTATVIPLHRPTQSAAQPPEPKTPSREPQLPDPAQFPS